MRAWNRHRAFTLGFVFVPLVAGVAVLSCEQMMPALGPYDEIFVVAERTPGEEVMEPLRDVFEISFETVQEETLFHLIPTSAQRLGEIENRKNYLILVDLSSRGALFDLAKDLLGRPALNDAIRSGKPTALFTTNAYSRQQVHAFLLAPNAADLPEAIREKGPSIRDEFLQENRRRILEYLFFRGEQMTLSRRLYEKFGWWIRIPTAFTTDFSHVDDGFFTMMMDRPGRRLFVWWKEGVEALPPPDEVMALRDSLGRLYYENDYVEARRTTTARASFQGRDAIRLIGLWQNEEKVIGGPFRSIAFVDDAAKRLYLLDYSVYAPGFTKKYYLWELESVIATFSLEPPPVAEEAKR